MTKNEPGTAACNLIKKQRQKASKALSNARQRCKNSKNKDYANYGALGIDVLFNNVDELISAIGLPSLKSTLDRIDPQGHYEAGNVRWVHQALQAANKKASQFGSTPSIAQLIKETKLELASEGSRGAVARAWQAMIGAFNRGYISTEDAAFLATELRVPGSLSATFDLNQHYDA